jgi:hypothetical protein
MAQTPNPTIEELRDYDALVNGDLGLALDELLRRLRTLLPLFIADKNERKGWSGPDAIELPHDIRLAPAVLSDFYLDSILVGAKVNTTPQGIGGVFRSEVEVTIYSIDERIQAEQQVRVAWARAEAIRAVLQPFLSGCIDAEDRPCWRMLEPTGYSLLRGDWGREYSGTQVTFRMVQSVSG